MIKYPVFREKIFQTRSTQELRDFVDRMEKMVKNPKLMESTGEDAPMAAKVKNTRDIFEVFESASIFGDEE